MTAQGINDMCSLTDQQTMSAQADCCALYFFALYRQEACRWSLNGLSDRLGISHGHITKPNGIW
jgi:hypothetical protein